MFLSSRDLKKVDSLGASISLICAAHCALQPILLLTLPIIGLGFLMNEGLESVLLVGSVLLAFWALFSGLRHHGQKRVLLPWFVGSALILSSRAMHELEIVLAVCGALCLAGSHFLNSHYTSRQRNAAHRH